MDKPLLLGLISFQDVTGVVGDNQNLENKTPKAYIHDCAAMDVGPKL